ncbi:hypothetical protein JCM19237_5268 [Photobacterium aphoticum]|uniref:Uncharacterized protein n=1 Tax=Photobacterium aphoticum TaxID=754436 RepID=A0A090QGV4_9GAMM|nr:hypothetical protein JCM19237_5268 [Photobacterium aphoticum]
MLLSCFLHKLKVCLLFSFYAVMGVGLWLLLMAQIFKLG